MQARASVTQAKTPPKPEAEPLVSVVLPVFNGRQYIRQAVDSILSQTLRELELIVINDGSTDDTLDQIRDIQDPRLRVVSRENRGLIATLNEGIVLSRSRYIARMDADDIAYPQRLQKQLDYLSRHPAVALCCTAVERIDAQGQLLLKERLSKIQPLYVENLVFGCPICHPTVMLNVTVIGKANLYYDADFKNTEDFELWCRLLKQHQGAKLPEPLLGYRIHEGSITTQFSALQRKRGIEALLLRVFRRPESRRLKDRLEVVYRTNLTSYSYLDFMAGNSYLILYALFTPEIRFFRQLFSSLRMLRIRLIRTFKTQKVRN